jgi:allantoin racemase
MEILVVNPNTTASMTDKIRAAAEAVASRGTRITAVNPEIGPESIEGYYDEALAVPGLLAEIGEGEARGVAGHVIACFDDTGLDAARALARAPVLGIGEAAFHLASLVAGRFSVITTLGRSVPAIEQNLAKYGLASRCARVRAAEIPVLALEDKDSQHIEIYDHLGDVLAALGEKKEAVAAWKKGLESITATAGKRELDRKVIVEKKIKDNQ